MNEFDPKVLERILTSDDELQPMTGFSTRVMRAIREEAAAPAPLAFPWARFLPGFLVNTALLLATATWLLFGPGSSAPATESMLEPRDHWIVLTGLLAAVSCVMTWAASRWSSLRRRSSF